MLILCWMNFSLVDVNKCLFTPGRDQQTKIWSHQSLSERFSEFLGLTHKAWVRGAFTCIIPSPYPPSVTHCFHGPGPLYLHIHHLLPTAEDDPELFYLHTHHMLPTAPMVLCHPASTSIIGYPLLQWSWTTLLPHPSSFTHCSNGSSSLYLHIHHLLPTVLMVLGKPGTKEQLLPASIQAQLFRRTN